jgi:hypothetical protein
MTHTAKELYFEMARRYRAGGMVELEPLSADRERDDGGDARLGRD